jgi:hypothetical protein
MNLGLAAQALRMLADALEDDGNSPLPHVVPRPPKKPKLRRTIRETRIKPDLSKQVSTEAQEAANEALRRKGYRI